jgi:hypothetical protein
VKFPEDSRSRVSQETLLLDIQSFILQVISYSLSQNSWTLNFIFCNYFYFNYFCRLIVPLVILDCLDRGSVSPILLKMYLIIESVLKIPENVTLYTVALCTCKLKTFSWESRYSDGQSYHLLLKISHHPPPPPPPTSASAIGRCLKEDGQSVTCRRDMRTIPPLPSPIPVGRTIRQYLRNRRTIVFAKQGFTVSIYISPSSSSICLESYIVEVSYTFYLYLSVWRANQMQKLSFYCFAREMFI